MLKINYPPQNPWTNGHRFKRPYDFLIAIPKTARTMMMPNGDVAGIGKNLIIVTSGGLTVDRNKIRGSY